MRKYFLLLGLFLFLFVSFQINAQEDGQIVLKDSSYLKKKNYVRQYEYENFQSAFKAPKKNTWALGLHGGGSFISGDVNPSLGWGAGLNIQKAFGHLVSVRLQSFYAIQKGIDWENNHDYLSYRTQFIDANLQAVFNLGNINFYKKQPKTLFYLFGGIGLAGSKTAGDRLDAAGNAYDFSVINEATTGALFPGTGEIGRSDVRKQLRELMDEEYETLETRQGTDFELSDFYIHPSFAAGLGVNFRISRRVDLTLEHRISFHSDDLLDGTNEATKRGNPVVSQGTDIVQYSNVGLSFKIGKREESLYWVNPLYTPLEDIRVLKEKLDKGNFFKDEDDDGVLDALDMEENTPPKVAVNTKGVTLDSDDDGIPNYLDKEVYTPAGSPIDANGVALDTDNDGVPDIFDQEANTPAGSLVDVNGRAIELQDSRALAFDMVYFDLNSSKVNKEFYKTIHDVASYMEANPSAKIEVTGHTDIRASEDYNARLGARRAESVVKVLTTTFGIPSSRLIVVSKGKTQNMVPNLPANYSRTFEPAHYLNRRVEFKVIK